MFSLNFLLILCVIYIEVTSNYNDINYQNVCESRIEKSNKNITALILARGGSKGIALKNIAKLNGTTLLGRAINSLQSSKVFDNIWISTDHDQIVEEVNKYEGVNIHLRNKNTALDTTPSIFAVQEFMETHLDIENIALIQCTSVFIKPKYLKIAYKKFKTSDCVFAITRSHKLRWKYDQTTKIIDPLNFDPMNRPRRQDWNGELVETGMFYFTGRNLVMKGIFQNRKCQFVDIANEDCLEIDTLIDLKWAQFLIENGLNS